MIIREMKTGRDTQKAGEVNSSSILWPLQFHDIELVNLMITSMDHVGLAELVASYY